MVGGSSPLQLGWRYLSFLRADWARSAMMRRLHALYDPKFDSVRVLVCVAAVPLALYAVSSADGAALALAGTSSQCGVVGEPSGLSRSFSAAVHPTAAWLDVCTSR